MTINVELQKQHRVSQIYLKQFGFLKDDKWYVSIWRKFIDHTDVELIQTFLREINIFDLPYEDFKDRRHFENTNNLIEREYSKIVNSLSYQHKLLPKHRFLLCHHVANMICRANPYRQFFYNLLHNPITRNKFLKEITMFKECGELNTLRNLLKSVQKDYQLNIVICSLMEYLVRVFRAFKFIILKDYDNRGWFTSDNPVIIDKQGNHSWIIPLESEIYFPLSKDFCLFMYNKNSKIQRNSLRNLKANEINLISDELYVNISEKILHNQNQFLIFPVEIEKTFFEDVKIELSLRSKDYYSHSFN